MGTVSGRDRNITRKAILSYSESLIRDHDQSGPFVRSRVGVNRVIDIARAHSAQAGGNVNPTVWVGDTPGTLITGGEGDVRTGAVMAVVSRSGGELIITDVALLVNRKVFAIDHNHPAPVA